MGSQVSVVVGVGTRFQGNMLCVGVCRIDGQFTGTITGEGTLVIGPAAMVDASVHVDDVLVLGGTVQGQVRANNGIEVHPGANVVAELHAPGIWQLDKPGQ